MPAHWVTNAIETFLDTHVIAFKKAQQASTISNEFMPMILREFLKEFPIPLLPADASPEERQIYNQTYLAKVLKQEKQLYSWFYNNHSGTNVSSSANALTNLVAPLNKEKMMKKHALTSVQVFSKVFYDSKVKPLVEKELENMQGISEGGKLPQGAHLPVIARLTNEVWEAASESVKAEVEKKRLELLEEDEEDNTVDEDEIIDRLPAIVEQFTSSIRQLNWTVSRGREQSGAFVKDFYQGLQSQAPVPAQSSDQEPASSAGTPQSIPPLHTLSLQQVSSSDPIQPSKRTKKAKKDTLIVVPPADPPTNSPSANLPATSPIDLPIGDPIRPSKPTKKAKKAQKDTSIVVPSADPHASSNLPATSPIDPPIDPSLIPTPPQSASPSTVIPPPQLHLQPYNSRPSEPMPVLTAPDTSVIGNKRRQPNSSSGRPQKRRKTGAAQITNPGPVEAEARVNSGKPCGQPKGMNPDSSVTAGTRKSTRPRQAPKRDTTEFIGAADRLRHVEEVDSGN
ncbi:hypothetical protein VKT23_014769 [Stygiomarasmius scandens]|uniref:Uncharacterized protein n=1 Tax=Marasmiellus scandens TaxID=2682957 RepID=A0ABR1J314_9AGAR